MDLTCVTIDCHDAPRLARFWSEALGWPAPMVAADGSGAICAPPDDDWYLEFVVVPEDKTVKNRLHLGCSVGSLTELDPEIDRLRGMDATVAWEEDFPPHVAEVYRNVVLRDPEGNEFCLGGGTYPSH